MSREDDDDAEAPSGRRWRGVALGAALLAGGVAAFVLLGHDDRPKRPANTVMRVVLPPPPPPPPVRKEEKPPEPQKSTEPPKMTDPTPARQPAKAAKAPAPPGTPLTAMAGAGTNAYGLGVGNGGGDTIGGGGGGGGSPFGAYAGQIQAQIQEALRRDEKTRSGRYLLTLRLWIGAAGQVQRAQLVSSSGDAATDASIIRVISASSIGQGPPADMPQPVTLRVRARAS
jgi:TonB family protein